MKFRKPGQVLLAAVVSLGVGFGVTSCAQSNTIDYLFVTANKNSPDGQISVYYVDEESGALTQIPDSPYSSGGRNPVFEVTSPDGNFLYVANQDDNTIVQFAIGSDGKLYPQHTCNTPGTEPSSLAIVSTPSSSGTTNTTLFVVDYYAPAASGQPPYTNLNPGPGALIAYNIQSSGSGSSLTSNFGNCTPVTNGSNSYWPLQNDPGGAAVATQTVTSTASSGGATTTTLSYLYVVNTNSVVSTTTPPTSGEPVSPPSGQLGSVSAFSINNGTLTALPGSPFQAGTAPTAIAADPTGRFLYVTDSAQNQLIGYNILATGVIQPINNGPFRTGTFPNGVTVDPRGSYIYVTNYTDGTISTYNIDPGVGTPTANSVSTVSSGDPGPTCILVDPSFGRFVYTSNFIGSTVGGLQLNPNSGSLTTNQNSPYPTAGQPTCVAAIPHGNHATQHVQATAGS